MRTYIDVGYYKSLLEEEYQFSISGVTDQHILDGMREFHAQMIRYVDKVPTANVAEVIRCKDCQWWAFEKDWKTSDDNGYHCNNPYYGMASGVDCKPDDFCSYGEKKTYE